jgi:hypothetical protein
MAELSEFVRTRHKISGAINEAEWRHVAEHEVLGADLEIVGPNVKPYLPEMHRTSLPADATPEQKAAAENAGLDLEEITVAETMPAQAAEIKATVAAERAKSESIASDTKKIGKG